jgi:hypothetical protein
MQRDSGMKQHELQASEKRFFIAKILANITVVMWGETKDQERGKNNIASE